MGLFTYTITGGGFILIGALESLSNPNPTSNASSPLYQINNPTAKTTTTQSSATKANHDSPNQDPSSLSSIFACVFSFLFIVNSLISLSDAVNSNDPLGSAIQLEIVAVAALFLLYSVLGLLTNFSTSLRFPSVILNLIALFAFVEEFLLFYLRRRDTSGIENRYFDLLLVPILICIFSTIIELRSPKSSLYARLARGIGLILQGTWFVQMGLSFYTNLMVHGCSLNEKTRGNYTIRCKGHPEYHRGRAIATLLFNCHLALLVVLVAGIYSVMAKKNGYGGEFMRYKPLGAEIIQSESNARFTLDSDEDEVDNEIKQDEPKQNGAEVEMVVNGHGNGSHQ
ncbi:hypothetical protein HS088_TW11G00410 [Tripterygium wilfordii]|uniref:Uncharacterized protein n=1 Tax=Tripterygium wilfordii TaxID=458696 RepID=A0A7J7D1Z3_TRIWF|nr:hypothetical protein HS088_TW11G00410 [Tripterygium wilfordii]